VLPGKSVRGRLGDATFPRSGNSRLVGAVRGMALLALGILWVMDDLSATATYMTALTFGWRLLIGAGSVKGASKEPAGVRVEASTRVPVKPRSVVHPR
jgi:hypothetical protein